MLCLTRTPCMYSKFIPLLFVGFAHNLRIESFVSVLGKLEKAHPNAASQLIDFMFTYRTDREHERECRRAATMRSVNKTGGARAAARELATEAKELGKARRAPLTAAQCSLLVPKLHAAAAKVTSGRGSCFKHAKNVAAGLARLKADTAQKKQTAARLGRKRPLNERERRLTADERPEQQRQQPARRKRANTVVEESSDDEEEYVGEEPDSEGEEEVGLPAGDQGTAEEETEEQRAHAAERRRRADLVRKLRADAAALRAELNALRSPHKLPTDPEKLVKYRKLLPLYQELKERLAGLDA